MKRTPITQPALFGSRAQGMLWPELPAAPAEAPSAIDRDNAIANAKRHITPRRGQEALGACPYHVAGRFCTLDAEHRGPHNWPAPGQERMEGEK